MISTKHRVLIENFCDRSLPCLEYSSWVQNDATIDFFQETEKIKKILEDKNTIKVIYGSFYLIGEIMRVSIYKPFA
jgi:folylpolyglutamate synthase/dihydropteroate synthase